MTNIFTEKTSIDAPFTSLSLRKINDEVYMATDKVVRFDRRYVELIKQSAEKNSRGRARICAHREPTDTLHEMMIAIRSDSYIRPHRHHQKVESFHLLEGSVDVVVFDDDGSISEVIELSIEGNFFYRLDSPKYHTLLIHSPLLVMHEITNGPFDEALSDWGSFSPSEGSTDVNNYVSQLRTQVKIKKRSIFI